MTFHLALRNASLLTFTLAAATMNGCGNGVDQDTHEHSTDTEAGSTESTSSDASSSEDTSGDEEAEADETGSDATGDEDTGDPAAPDIAGRWVSPCLPDGEGGAFHLDFDIDASTWTLDYVAHGTETCDFPLMTVHIAGPYELEQPSPSVAGAWEGQFGFDVKELMPHVEGVIDFLESPEGCDFEGFAVGVATDVYEMGCPGLGQYPQAICEADYDLVALDEEGLRFGERPADNDMCTPDKRPVALSPLVLTPGGA
jgi:hypothetical protein